MYLQQSRIIFIRDGIETYTFDTVVDVKISRNWEEITSTAEIAIPNRVRLKNKFVLNEFKRGDQVKIYLGLVYLQNNIKQNTLKECFSGYISSVKNDDVIRIKCEDNMWILKQRTIQKYTKKDITLKTYVDDLFALAGLTYKYELINPETKIGSYRIQNSNLAECFLKLRELGLFARFDGSTFKIDTPYSITLTESQKQAKTKNFCFQHNIFESNLDYRLTTDTNIVVKGVSIDSADKKTTLYAYYDSSGKVLVSNQEQQGNQITRTYYNKTETELNELIKSLLPNINYSGYYGNFKTIGLFGIEPGYFVKLYDNKYSERSHTSSNPQRYVIKSVETIFGKDGYFQTAEIGAKA